MNRKPEKKVFFLLVVNAMTFNRLFIVLFIAVSGELCFAADHCINLFTDKQNAGLFSRLRQSLSRILPIQKPRYEFLDDSEKNVWRDLVSSEAKYKKVKYLINSRGSSDDPMLLFIWMQLPAEAQQAMTRLLSQATGSQREIRDYVVRSLSEISPAVSDSNLLFEEFLSTWLNDRNGSDINFQNWILKGTQQYDDNLKAKPYLLTELQVKYDWAKSATEASQNWSNKIGVHTINTFQKNGQNVIEINNLFYAVKVNEADHSIQIRIPRNRIRVAAWNPIYHEVLLKKVQQGGQPLKKYPAFLAANGYFYLSDGNHRFTLDTREEVWVEMSYPVRTSSMGITFDAMGLVQPSIEDLILYDQGEKSLVDIIKGRTTEILTE